MMILTEARKGCERAKNPPQYQYEQHNDAISIQLYPVTHTKDLQSAGTYSTAVMHVWAYRCPAIHIPSINSCSATSQF